MSNLTDALIAAKLVGGSGGSGGGNLPEAYQNIIVAGEFEPISDTSADFTLYGYDGWIYGNFNIAEDAETQGVTIEYTFQEDVGGHVPSFWGDGGEGVTNGLSALLNIKLEAEYDGVMIARLLIGEPMAEEPTLPPCYIGYFTL